MAISTLTTKGQFTIPIEHRKTLSLHSGDKITCYVEGDKLIIVPVKGAITNVKGMFGKAQRTASLEDIDEAIAKEVANNMGEI